MKFLTIATTLVAFAILQAVIPAWGYMGNAKWPLLAGVVFYHALNQPRHVALSTAVLAGLLHDALGMIPLGYTSFAFFLPALVLNRYRDKIFGGEWLTQMLMGGTMAILVTLLTGVLLMLGEQLPIHASGLFLKCVGVGLLSLVAMPSVAGSLRALDLRLGLIREGAN